MRVDARQCYRFFVQAWRDTNLAALKAVNAAVPKWVLWTYRERPLDEPANRRERAATTHADDGAGIAHYDLGVIA